MRSHYHQLGFVPASVKMNPQNLQFSHSQADLEPHKIPQQSAVFALPYNSSFTGVANPSPIGLPIRLPGRLPSSSPQTPRRDRIHPGHVPSLGHYHRGESVSYNSCSALSIRKANLCRSSLRPFARTLILSIRSATSSRCINSKKSFKGVLSAMAIFSSLSREG